MATGLSILPLNYDVEYIIQEAGVVNHFGYEEREDGIHFKYRLDDYDAIQVELDVYETKYLEVALPAKIEECIELRRQKVLDFTFGGLPIELNQETQTNLTGSVLGLERNPQVPGMDWHMGDGVYIFIPRDDLMAIADAAFVHIQQTFSNQKRLLDLMRAAADIHELEAIDLEEGWPVDFITGV